MIQQCVNCNGLFATMPRESFAGQPCMCGNPKAGQPINSATLIFNPSLQMLLVEWRTIAKDARYDGNFRNAMFGCIGDLEKLVNVQPV